jgi:hypothetical protein
MANKNRKVSLNFLNREKSITTSLPYATILNQNVLSFRVLQTVGICRFQILQLLKEQNKKNLKKSEKSAT